MAVRVTEMLNRLYVESPYNPDWIKAAKALGGNYNGSEKAWLFKPEQEAVVRENLVAVYGFDGSEAKIKVRVTVTQTGDFGRHQNNDGCWTIGGQKIVCVRFKDGGAWTPNGVTQVAGKASRSGGSRKYPCPIIEAGAAFETEIAETLWKDAQPGSYDHYTIERI